MSLDNDNVDRLIREGEFDKLKSLVAEQKPDLKNLTRVTRKLRAIGQDIEKKKRKEYSKTLEELDIQIHRYVIEVVIEAGQMVSGSSNVINPMRAQLMSGMIGTATMGAWLIVQLDTEDPAGIISSLSALTYSDISESMKGLERGLVGHLDLVTMYARTYRDSEVAKKLPVLEFELLKAKTEAEQTASSVWMKGIQGGMKGIILKGLSPDLSSLELEHLIAVYLQLVTYLLPSELRELMSKSNLTKNDIRKIVDKTNIAKKKKEQILSELEQV